MYKLKDKDIKNITFEFISTNDSEFRLLKAFEILMGDIVKQNNHTSFKRKENNLSNRPKGETTYGGATEKTSRRPS